MSEDSDSKPYRFPALAEQAGLAGFEPGPPSEGSDGSGRDAAAAASPPEEDVEMKSGGSSGSSAAGSHGHRSPSSSNGHSKDSALLESSESNKSSNSHSPSPPSSSNAYSLLSSEQDNPSTSGCSSQDSAKAKTQKELLKTLKELKLHLPAEKRHCRRSSRRCSTLTTLQYALRCVRQVEANEEYQQLLLTDGLDAASYTLQEIHSITSQFTLRNNDIFAVAVSLVTGRIVYISEQAAAILGCSSDVFRDSKLVEFMTPQDVSVFYSFTTPYRLPSWSMCTGAESTPSDCMQEKSFFCRISGGKRREAGLQYLPFRMTPYRMKVQDAQHAEEQLCCLLLAERVHSGYEAPRIPPDKRVFTTTHSPGCVFQDVDDRAVPLLGFLPQDLIGTPVLLRLHPSDRPVMLAIHRKILQYAGQPFDHSSVRFCARNGEYVILDTSWSSFVNPWSRKVSFVIGRHKVRMGPVNEDVFVAPGSCGGGGEAKGADSDVQELTEQIHRLLLQPVHTSSSSGYGSLNGTDHLLGMTSSSESLNHAGGSRRTPDEDEEDGRVRPRTFQALCKGLHLQKNQEQQLLAAPPERRRSSSGTAAAAAAAAAVRPKDSAAPLEELKEATLSSYQQISCLDGVIRYLESCSVPATMKRKCQSSSNTTSSSCSDEDGRQASPAGGAALKGPSGKKPGGVVDASPPLPLPSRPESVASVTSQCSYSSTIVHVGDKKTQPESELMEDVPTAGDGVDVCPCPEREFYRKLGLTKQVLAAHTQKEEQVFLSRCRDLQLRSSGSPYLQGRRAQPAGDARRPAAEPDPRRGPRTRRTRSKRAKQAESSDSAASRRGRRPPRPPLLNQTSWSPSEASQPCPAAVPGFPLQGTPPPCPLPVFPPVVAPFLALVLPNYLYPVMGLAAPPSLHPPGHLGGQQHFAPPSCFPPPPETPRPAEGPSRSSTPRSGGGPTSPPLFQSRCSSPLNLLELELSVERQDGAAPPAGGQANDATDGESGAAGGEAKERELTQTSSRGDSNNSDANSSSSDMLDIILQEDSCSGTGSATSGSVGCGTSASGTSRSRTSDSGTGSNDSSRYFGSVDSSQSSQRVKGQQRRPAPRQSERLIRSVLQDPPWLLMADADDKLMMTYRLPSRDLQRVLMEDRQKLRLLQRNQPRFSSEQQQELQEVHGWMKEGVLPDALDVTMCCCCEDTLEDGDDRPGLDDADAGDVCPQREEEEEPHAVASSAGSALQVGPGNSSSD